jgi:hypothetical protein
MDIIKVDFKEIRWKDVDRTDLSLVVTAWGFVLEGDEISGFVKDGEIIDKLHGRRVFKRDPTPCI